MSTSEFDTTESTPPTVLLLLGLSVNGDLEDELPFTVADDLRLHVISGLPGIRGTYNGRDRVARLFQTLDKNIDGDLGINVEHMAPPNFGPDNTFLVTLSTLTAGQDPVNSWEVCFVGRQEEGRIQEAWIISATVANPGLGAIFRIVGSIATEFAMDCESCGRTSDVSLRKLSTMMLPPTFWNPLRGDYSLWTKCPRCGNRAWMALEIPVLGPALRAFNSR